MVLGLGTFPTDLGVPGQFAGIDLLIAILHKGLQDLWIVAQVSGLAQIAVRATGSLQGAVVYASLPNMLPIFETLPPTGNIRTVAKLLGRKAIVALRMPFSSNCRMRGRKRLASDGEEPLNVFDTL